MNGISTRTVTELASQHPTDHRWWGVMLFEPAGRSEVHVRVRNQATDLSVPFVKLDDLQELLNRARRACEEAGFIE